MSGPTDENASTPGSAAPRDVGDVHEPEGDDAAPPGDAVRDRPAPSPARTEADHGAEDETGDDAIRPVRNPASETAGETLPVRPGHRPAQAAETRPCAYCGRPIQQPGDSSPAVRYCPDNGGACARAAAERRRRDQDSPGLAGQVARTWDMVERLEDVAELLALSLTGGLSVAGVERRLAEARAEEAAGLAEAQREREAAREEAERGLAQVGAVRDELQRAESRATELIAGLERAHAEREAAQELVAHANRTAEAANAAIVTVREERDRLTSRVEELTLALDDARGAIARQRGQLAEAKEFQKRAMALEETRTRLRATESELDKMRTTAEIAQKARTAVEQACAEADRQALEARSHAEELTGERDELIAERDALAADLKECREELTEAEPRLAERDRLAAELEQCRLELEEHQSRLLEQDQLAEQLRGALATMISERDAARIDADEAKAAFERLSQAEPQGARHARPAEQDSPTGEGGQASAPYEPPSPGLYGAPYESPSSNPYESPSPSSPGPYESPSPAPYGSPEAGPYLPPPGPFASSSGPYPIQPTGHEVSPGHDLASGHDLSPGHDLPPGHDLGGVTGPPESFRRRFLPPPEE